MCQYQRIPQPYSYRTTYRATTTPERRTAQVSGLYPACQTCSTHAPGQQFRATIHPLSGISTGRNGAKRASLRLAQSTHPRIGLHARHLRQSSFKYIPRPHPGSATTEVHFLSARIRLGTPTLSASRRRTPESGLSPVHGLTPGPKPRGGKRSLSYHPGSTRLRVHPCLCKCVLRGAAGACRSQHLGIVGIRHDPAGRLLCRCTMSWTDGQIATGPYCVGHPNIPGLH